MGTTFYRRKGKRWFDVVFASGFLVAASPLYVVIALLVRSSLGKPLIFRQARPGLGAKSFEILKFRTMTSERDERGELLPDSARLTAVGRALRATSLDELPEFLNVLRGQMSVVGPRPLLTSYVPRYSPEQARRHDVRPGITGWSQVNGRNAVTWAQRLRDDVWYVDHVSFWLDLKVLALTVWLVLTRDGISAPGHPTMPGFYGTGEQGEEHQDASSGKPGSGTEQQA